MTERSFSVGRARELLAVSPPAGARARVLHRVLAVRPATVRKPVARALVVVTALLVSATAAAVGGPALVRWTRSSWTHVVPRQTGAPPSHVAASRPRDSAARTPVSLPKVEPSPDAPAPPSAAAAVPVPSLPPAAVAVRAAAPPVATTSTSTLAQEVAAYREAAALVATSPGLAIVRLRAHRERFPASALGPEVSLRLVQAFTALRRSADARREAQSFLIRYPRSPKRAEMQAIVDGAPQRGAGE